MEKQKRWQLFLIIAVLVLTIYNILPTLFFYTKPLKDPIDEKKATRIAQSIVDRINSLEKQSIEWISSYCSLLQLKPLSIQLDAKDPELVTVSFKNVDDAKTFRSYLPRAGALIPFAPAQLSTYDTSDADSKAVIVKRKIPIHIDSDKIASFFQYSTKTDTQGNVAPLYRALVDDRALEVAVALAGSNENAQYVQAVANGRDEALNQELAIILSQNLLSFVNAFGENSEVAKRYFASFSQTSTSHKSELINNFLNKLEQINESVRSEKEKLEAEAKVLQSKNSYLDTAQQQKLHLLTSRNKMLSSSYSIFKRNQALLSAGKQPATYSSIGSAIQKNSSLPGKDFQELSLEGRNPFFDKLIVDWQNEKIYLSLYADLEPMRNAQKSTNAQEQIDQILYNELAYVNRQSGETITPVQGKFEINLNQLTNSKSFLAFRLSAIAQAEAQEVKQAIISNWKPQHQDLQPGVFPVSDFDKYQTLTVDQKELGIVVYAPITHARPPENGFRMNSIYVIAKGVDKILQKYKANPAAEQAQQFFSDFYKLRDLLSRNGFVGYSGSSISLNKEFAEDYIFEAPDYFQSILMASREDFTVHGTKRYAVLEFSDVEQRILTENKIDTRIHEDLLKWRDDYQAAQLSIKGVSRYDVPKPTKNALVSNLKLSTIKYFRGDDRKILHWGLDLSGGKTVQIELRDTSNRLVENEADIKQGINELYNRVNKMGVSEVSIRQEGNYITLDFPGSQAMSASDLVKASSMFFHVVNEKFGPYNSLLADASNRFLQEVWNEAVITNRKSSEEINQIAWKHLYGDSLDPDIVQPRSEAARILFDNGLRLANPQEEAVSSVFNDTYSKVALFRGEDYTQWSGQTHPLLIVFRNFALEGSNLENVHASYDPSRGNYLSFGVKGTYTNKAGIKQSPREDFSAWTTPFSKEKVSGTPNENYSKKRGWRMAVILNGSIVSAPTLDSALRDSAMITGSFSQREINQLEADLKAGSLSFTPHILSEKNVSPELGAKERSLGIWATVIALVLVVGVMISYYRFGGVIASVAVIFNLLIMWATLQNIQATLTLASIAGLILTVGMAVDANVLVFERIREEFALTGRIATAIQSGYKKAFSAIVDSNVTTIIAALILLHFDSGPIKGFAITLIIGIVSSMFTALFMTRYFFSGWVQNPKNKQLSMLNIFRARNYNFLKHTKKTIALSTVVIALGIVFFATNKQTIMGMDFTGGYALNLEIQPHSGADYRQEVERALLQQGIKPQDFQIRELSPANNVRLFLSQSLEQPGRPFYNLDYQSDASTGLYQGQNPKIVWLLQAFQKSALPLTSTSIQAMDSSWSEISGQMSETMRDNAVIGLMIALICILAYITLRFEFKYAISATICLAHDVVFTIGALAILHGMGVPIQIDLNIIAALMTIVGYSLNDTIIVFDRIREDVRTMRKSTFTEIINHALNVTLSRTMMTSGTTLLVLVPLVSLGGSTIFGFSLVMAIGVIFGTLSSLFIAAPLMLYFHNKEIAKQEKLALNSH